MTPEVPLPVKFRDSASMLHRPRWRGKGNIDNSLGCRSFLCETRQLELHLRRPLREASLPRSFDRDFRLSRALANRARLDQASASPELPEWHQRTLNLLEVNVHTVTYRCLGLQYVNAYPRQEWYLRFGSGLSSWSLQSRRSNEIRSQRTSSNV